MKNMWLFLLLSSSSLLAINASEIASKYGVDFLIHKTHCKNIDSILKSGALMSGKEVNRTGYGPENDPLEEIYMSFHFKDIKETEKDKCILYFNINLLNSRNDYHITNQFLYGVKINRPTYQGNLLVYSADKNDLPKMESIIKHIRENVMKDMKENITDLSEISSHEIVFYHPVQLSPSLMQIRVPENYSIGVKNLLNEAKVKYKIITN